MAGIDSYTKLCLHGEGSDGATTFRDASFGHKTITRSGSAQIDTAQKKFGAASVLLGNFNYLTLADSADWCFGTGDFTIDLWVRFASLPGSSLYYMFCSQYVDSNNRWYFSVYETAGTYKLTFNYKNSIGTASISRTITPSINTWYHYAVVKSGSEYRLYCNGTQLSTEYTSSLELTDLSSSLFVGTWYVGGGLYHDGWVDELRVSKGVARWTTDFTPETVAYSIDDTITEALTTSDDLVPDPGLPTDAEITEDLAVHDTLADVYDVDIDEDIALNDTFAGSASYLCVQVEAVTTNDSNVANTTYNKTLSEDVTSGDVFDGQFAVYMTTGNQNVPICKAEAKRNKGFVGDATFPKASNTSKKGWDATHTVPKWVAEATLKRGSLFSHEERVPKLKGEATFKTGRVFAGDAVFPGFIADSTFITSVEFSGATHTVPKPKGFATMTVGGRFTDYVLRYVR